MAVAALLSVGLVESASACSCDRGDPLARYEESKAAFNGTLLDRNFGQDPEGTELIFRVDEPFKGVFNGTIALRTSGSSSCSLDTSPGEQIGLFLNSTAEGTWVGLCDAISPEDLRKVAGGPPPPDGEGPIAAILGGRIGEAQTVAVDEQGRTLAYGMGGHYVSRLSVCPGSERFAEVYKDHRRKPRLVIRETSSMAIVRESVLPLNPSGSGQRVADISCRDPNGDEVVVFSTDYANPWAESFIYEVRPNEVVVLHSGRASSGEFLLGGSLRHRVYMRDGYRGRRISYFDLLDGKKHKIGRVPQIDTSVSPDGTRLAGLTPGDFAVLKMVDLTADPPTVKKRRLGLGIDGEILWLDDVTFALLPGAYDNDRVVLFNSDLERLSKPPGYWYSFRNDYSQGTAWGIGWGELFKIELPEGSAELLREFVSGTFSTVAIVPDEIFPSPAP